MNNSLEIMKYSNLADAGYRQGLAPIGWEILKTTSNLDSGFAATAFRNIDTREIVISYRGTDDWRDMTGSDLSLALQKTPDQYIEAKDFYDQVKNQYGETNLSITGHSLGGALAQLVGAWSGKPAYSFNGPGVDGIRPTIDDFKGNTADASSFTNIHNYNMAFDGISTRGTQLGSVTNYNPSSLEGLTLVASIAATTANPLVGALIFGKTILGQHYMDCLEEAIATPKSIDIINDYIYDSQSGEWSTYDISTGYKIADAQTTQSLNSQRQENIAYNNLADKTKEMLTEYRSWQTATEQLRVKYGQVWTDFDPGFDGDNGWFQDAKGNYIAQFEIVEENGQNLLRVLGGNGQTVNLDTGDVSGIGTLFYDLNSGLQNLINGFSNSDTAQAINTYGPSLIDALSLLKAIQSGEPLPVVTSGIRLANDISMINNNPNYVLSGAASAASGVLSIMSLEAALKSGDTMAAISATANSINFAASAYASFAGATSGLSYEIGQQLMGSGIDHMGTNALGLTDGAIPYLNLVMAIQSGDEAGIAVAVVSLIPGMQLVGIAYGVYSMIDSLFGGHDIPDPWGTGRFVWDGTSIKIQSAGKTGGNEAVSGVMQSVLTAMNSLIEQQRLTNPTSSLGIIANRMPSVAYDMMGYVNNFIEIRRAA